MDISEVKNTIYHLTHDCYGESEVTDAICELRKLCDYLDTGLTPEQIEVLKSKCKTRSAALDEANKHNSELCKEVVTLKKALSQINNLAVDFQERGDEAFEFSEKVYELSIQPEEEK